MKLQFPTSTSLARRSIPLFVLLLAFTLGGCNKTTKPDVTGDKGGPGDKSGSPDKGPPPKLIDMPIPMAKPFAHQTSWEAGAGKATGDDPYVVFALDKPRRVSSLRFKIAVENTGEKTALVSVLWRNGAVNDFTEKERLFAKDVPTGSEQTLTIPVNDTIDAIRIDPDIRRCDFRISELIVVVPEEK